MLRASAWLLGGLGVALGAFFMVRSVVIRAPAPIPIGESSAIVRLAGREFRLEIAYTPERRARGLAGRAGLGEDGGMLFLFDAPFHRSFWMKDMHFPIDILWLADGAIRGIAANVEPPPPGAADADIPRLSSPGPIDAAIEIRAGRAGELGLAPGQRVEILLP